MAKQFASGRKFTEKGLDAVIARKWRELESFINASTFRTSGDGESFAFDKDILAEGYGTGFDYANQGVSLSLGSNQAADDGVTPFIDFFAGEPTYIGARIILAVKDDGASNYSGTLQIRAKQLLFEGGTAANPGVAWVGDTDTGVFRVSADVLGFAIGGHKSVEIGRSSQGSFIKIFPNSTSTSEGGQLYLEPGSSYANEFYIDRYQNSIRFIYNASVAGEFVDTSQFKVGAVYSDTTTGSANVIVASTGRIQRTTSAKKYKDKVKDAADLADVTLRPVSYRSKLDGKQWVGFIADEIAAQNPIFGVYGDDDEVEDYDTRSVLAILAAKVNRLEKAA